MRRPAVRNANGIFVAAMASVDCACITIHPASPRVTRLSVVLTASDAMRWPRVSVLAFRRLLGRFQREGWGSVSVLGSSAKVLQSAHGSSAGADVGPSLESVAVRRSRSCSALVVSSLRTS
jgi:hypothetical protein